MSGAVGCDVISDEASYEGALIRELGDSLVTPGLQVTRVDLADEYMPTCARATLSEGEEFDAADPFRILAAMHRTNAVETVSVEIDMYLEDGTRRMLRFELTAEGQLSIYEGRAPRPGVDFDLFIADKAEGITPDVLTAIASGEIPPPDLETLK